MERRKSFPNSFKTRVSYMLTYYKTVTDLKLKAIPDDQPFHTKTIIKFTMALHSLELILHLKIIR